MSNPIQDALNRNYEEFKLSSEGLKIRGFKTKLVLKPNYTGTSEVATYKETYDPEGNLVSSDKVTNTNDIPREDPINNALNWAIFGALTGGAGWFNGALPSTLGATAKLLPRLSFSATSTAGKGLGVIPSTSSRIADMVLFNAIPAGVAANELKNNLNLQNSFDFALAAFPIISTVNSGKYLRSFAQGIKLIPSWYKDVKASKSLPFDNSSVFNWFPYKRYLINGTPNIMYKEDLTGRNKIFMYRPHEEAGKLTKAGPVIMDTKNPGMKEIHYTIISPDGTRIKSPNRTDKLALGRFSKKVVPKGTRFAPLETTTRTLLLLSYATTPLLEFFKLFHPNELKLTESHFTPDSYIQAILNGSKNRLEYSNQHYMNSLIMDIPGVKNQEVYSLFKALLENPNKETLKAVNDYLIKITGLPIKLVNGELQIPIPITYN